MQVAQKATAVMNDVRFYWNHPRPGEYVSYQEIVKLSIGWMALQMATQWTIGFGVGNEFTGMTLKMTNFQLLVMSYVCTAIGYVLQPLNAWIVDNLRNKRGKYRVFILLAVPSMILTLISLWLPYEQVRDSSEFGQYIMIAMLFIAGQVQGYVQNWFRTGVDNMVHVITPNSQERTKIMSITGIIYSLGYTITNVYFPAMVDILSPVGDKYNMRFYRGAYTPVALLAPIVLIAYFGTKERLVLPKSRITTIPLGSSIKAVAENKIFWIRCIDSWNDFLEGAKGDIWGWMVYRAHIMKSTTYGILNNFAHNAQFWAMLTSPWFIKRFGKRNIKIVKNIVQVFVLIGMRLSYKARTPFLVGLVMFVSHFIDRFVDCGVVIDSAIESDMRDNQQYLTGERIDGAFGMIRTYMNGVIGMFTGLFVPWIYSRKGFDGTNYSVLDLFINYDANKPYDQQTKNPNSVLFELMDVLLFVSICGAIIDVIPWFFYDITENGQKGMIRVVRIRTIIEDRDEEELEESNYLEGCEAVQNARKYIGMQKMPLPGREAIQAARAMPKKTDEEKEARAAAIQEAKQAAEAARTHNDEVEIAKFVMHELTRFENDFGKKQLEICQMIVAGGIEGFYNCYNEAHALAIALPKTEINEERKWRKQEIRNANALHKSAALAAKYYPQGIVAYDPQAYEDAYNMPDDTKEQAKARKAAMRAAEKEKNTFAKVCGPYLSAKRTVDLAAGYRDLDTLLSKYDEVNAKKEARIQEEHEEATRLAQTRAQDAETRAAERAMKKANRKRK